MKVGHNPEITNALAGVARQQAKAGSAGEVAARGTERTAAAGVPVTLSPAARKADNLRSTPEFDAVKVDSIKTAIANGSFTVNAEAVADKMLAGAQEALARANAR